jgi:hypothetical protein
MSLATELLESAIGIAPGIAALALALVRTRAIRGWVLKVLSAAVLAVVGLGLLLQRLTATCPAAQPTCPPNESLLPRVPGLIKDCYLCGAPGSRSDIATVLNESALQLQAGSALVCVLVSLVTTISFLFWARKQLT